MLFYVSILSALDVKFKFLASRVELTRFLVESSQVELKICSIWLKSSWKCEQLDFESSRIQNVNSKLDSTISLIRKLQNLIHHFSNLFFCNDHHDNNHLFILSINCLINYDSSLHNLSCDNSFYSLSCDNNLYSLLHDNSLCNLFSDSNLHHLNLLLLLHLLLLLLLLLLLYHLSLQLQLSDQASLKNQKRWRRYLISSSSER